MGMEKNGQPESITTKDHHGVYACCEKARVYLHTDVVDHRTVRGDTFGRFDAVDAGGNFQSVEGDIGCQGINDDAVG